MLDIIATVMSNMATVGHRGSTSGLDIGVRTWTKVGGSVCRTELMSAPAPALQICVSALASDLQSSCRTLIMLRISFSWISCNSNSNSNSNNHNTVSKRQPLVSALPYTPRKLTAHGEPKPSAPKGSAACSLHGYSCYVCCHAVCLRCTCCKFFCRCTYTAAIRPPQLQSVLLRAGWLTPRTAQKAARTAEDVASSQMLAARTAQEG
jgi:hypothetical protein